MRFYFLLLSPSSWIFWPQHFSKGINDSIQGIMSSTYLFSTHLINLVMAAGRILNTEWVESVAYIQILSFCYLICFVWIFSHNKVSSTPLFGINIPCNADILMQSSFAQRCFDLIEEYAPGFNSSIIGYDMLTPPDLEREIGLTGNCSTCFRHKYEYLYLHTMTNVCLLHELMISI